MPLTQVMQGPGHWSIELDGDHLPVPRAVTDQIPVGTEGFGHVVFTPTRIEPDEIDYTTLFELAVYVGRYIVQRDRTILSGDHINAWLGDSEGKGLTTGADLSVDQGFIGWIDDIQPDDAPFPQGSIGTPGFTLNYTWGMGVSQRAALDVVCRWFGMEWRVRNTLVFDANLWTILYGATPTVIATPWWDGADTELTGMRATISTETSLERYAAVVYSEFGNALDPNYPFDAPGLYEMPWLRLSGGNDIDSADQQAFVEAEGAERWALDPTLKITTDDFCPLANLGPGDPLYVFNPDGEVYDFDNEVHYGGHILWPKLLRVQAIVDMPVRAGMGVYFMTADDVVDLTDYVKFETGSARIEVGNRVRTMRPSMSRRGYDA